MTEPAWHPDFPRPFAGEGCGVCAIPDTDDIGWALRLLSGTSLDAYPWRCGQIPGCTVARRKRPRHVADPLMEKVHTSAHFPGSSDLAGRPSAWR